MDGSRCDSGDIGGDSQAVMDMYQKLMEEGKLSDICNASEEKGDRFYSDQVVRKRKHLQNIPGMASTYSIDEKDWTLEEEREEEEHNERKRKQSTATVTKASNKVDKSSSVKNTKPRNSTPKATTKAATNNKKRKTATTTNYTFSALDLLVTTTKPSSNIMSNKNK
jgi:hypothetical protein